MAQTTVRMDRTKINCCVEDNGSQRQPAGLLKHQLTLMSIEHQQRLDPAVAQNRMQYDHRQMQPRCIVSRIQVRPFGDIGFKYHIFNCRCSPLLAELLSEKCEIKKVPHNGWIEFVATSRPQIAVGNLVNSFTPVTYHCLPDHILSGKESNICFNGEWMYEVPDCVEVTFKFGSHQRHFIAFIESESEGEQPNF